MLGINSAVILQSIKGTGYELERRMELFHTMMLAKDLTSLQPRCMHGNIDPGYVKLYQQ